jgi:hypothetical protein
LQKTDTEVRRFHIYILRWQHVYLDIDIYIYICIYMCIYIHKTEFESPVDFP